MVAELWWGICRDTNAMGLLPDMKNCGLVEHAPGMPGTLSLPMQVSEPDMHHGTGVPLCMLGSVTSNFLWSRWQGKRSGIHGASSTRNFTCLARGPLCHWCAKSGSSMVSRRCSTGDLMVAGSTDVPLLAGRTCFGTPVAATRGPPAVFYPGYLYWYILYYRWCLLRMSAMMNYLSRIHTGEVINIRHIIVRNNIVNLWTQMIRELPVL